MLIATTASARAHRPGPRGGIELEREPSRFGKACQRPVCRDALTCVGVTVGRLPVRDEAGSAAKCTACSPVPLAISSSDAVSRQHPPEDGEDRLAVARDRGGTGGAIWKSIHLELSVPNGAMAVTISINGCPAMHRGAISPGDLIPDIAEPSQHSISGFIVRRSDAVLVGACPAQAGFGQNRNSPAIPPMPRAGVVRNI